MDSSVAAFAFNSISGSLANYTNMLHKCPYEGYHYVKDFPITSDVAHPSMPTGDYRSDIRFFNGKNKTIFFVKLYLNFKRKWVIY